MDRVACLVRSSDELDGCMMGEIFVFGVNVLRWTLHDIHVILDSVLFESVASFWRTVEEQIWAQYSVDRFSYGLIGEWQCFFISPLCYYIASSPVRCFLSFIFLVCPLNAKKVSTVSLVLVFDDCDRHVIDEYREVLTSLLGLLVFPSWALISFVQRKST